MAVGGAHLVQLHAPAAGSQRPTTRRWQRRGRQCIATSIAGTTQAWLHTVNQRNAALPPNQAIPRPTADHHRRRFLLCHSTTALTQARTRRPRLPFYPNPSPYAAHPVPTTTRLCRAHATVASAVYRGSAAIWSIVSLNPGLSRVVVAGAAGLCRDVGSGAGPAAVATLVAAAAVVAACHGDAWPPLRTEVGEEGGMSWCGELGAAGLLPACGGWRGKPGP